MCVVGGSIELLHSTFFKECKKEEEEAAEMGVASRSVGRSVGRVRVHNPAWQSNAATDADII